MKSHANYSINGWMLNELNLRGNNLLVFANIFSFSKDGSSEFTGSLKYLCGAIGASKNTVIKSLNDLQELGYIIKRTDVISGVTVNRYSQNEQVVQKLVHGIPIIGIEGSSETGTNNTIINNTIDKEENSTFQIPILDTDVINKLPKKEKEIGPQIFFRDSQWNSYDTLREKLKLDESFKKLYAGVDLRAYIDDALAWSEKGNKTTDLGWYLTIRRWIRDAKEKGSMHKLPEQPKTNQENLFYNQ